MARFHLSVCACALFASTAFAQQTPSETAKPDSKPPQTLAQRTAMMQHMPGMLGLDWDSRAGKVYLEVPMGADATHTRSSDFIYSLSLVHGAGSNDLGLDRGQIGGVGEGGSSTLVHFQRSGPKVLLLQPNESFRSSATDLAEQASVHESFAESVMWGFKVDAEAPDGTVLLDATDFFVRDARGVADVLTRMQQGSYKFDASRSAAVPEQIKAFPKNVVVESIITTATDGPVRGRYVRDVTPDPRAVTVHERQMFVALPEAGYTPRRYSPRSGYFADASYRDYSVPLGQTMEQNFIARHRLIKKDPNCKARCETVQPIQYYVDRGAPEPIRSALVEGARWWDQAFQAAGWAPGTFKVDVLPEGADPMDVRYNIIQWVHRYTRGWSYGAFIADPRTGEIIKGQVTLGSLRGRQDYLIAEALLSPYVSGKPDPRRDPKNDRALQMVLQRIRQLAAHETGHTLGLAHNFAASSFPHDPNTTGSVMDYPHPLVILGKDGVPDLSHAYPVNIGLWDKVAIDYGYREFDHDGKVAENPAELDAILRASEKRGLVFITDEDARPLGSAHPHAHLWDNGVDPADELNRVLTIRAAALARFGEAAVPPGTTLAQLEDTLVPLYLFHRYQTEAAAKEIGGLDYRYSVRGDGQMLPEIVSGAEQRKALAAVMKTLSPEVLSMPESLLKIFPPRTPELPRTQESFASETGLTFDPVASAESAADLTLALLLEPERASRLVEYNLRSADSPSLPSVLDELAKAVAQRSGDRTITSETQRAIETRAYEMMLSLAANSAASSDARAITRAFLVQKAKQWQQEAVQDQTEAAHHAALVARIEQFEREPEKFLPVKPIDAPPGMPIGDDED